VCCLVCDEQRPSMASLRPGVDYWLWLYGQGGALVGCQAEVHRPRLTATAWQAEQDDWRVLASALIVRSHAVCGRLRAGSELAPKARCGGRRLEAFVAKHDQPRPVAGGRGALVCVRGWERPREVDFNVACERCVGARHHACVRLGGKARVVCLVAGEATPRVAAVCDKRAGRAVARRGGCWQRR
jgi:hypothetical protein